jgi:hypothetical protein
MTVMDVSDWCQWWISVIGWQSCMPVMDPITSLHHWDTQLPSIPSIHHWHQSPASITDTNPQHPPLVSITDIHNCHPSLASTIGIHHWHSTLTSITGNHHWLPLLTSITSIHHWHQSNGGCWGLVSVIEAGDWCQRWILGMDGSCVSQWWRLVMGAEDWCR